jgi:hypothetical protein
MIDGVVSRNLSSCFVKETYFHIMGTKCVPLPLAVHGWRDSLL